MSQIRRALASMLLAVFSFPLIAPAILADSTGLPACCRRDGRHQCGMADAADGIRLKAIPLKCALFPKAEEALSAFHTALPGRLEAPGALLAFRPVNRKTDDQVPQLPRRGSTHKRGPPSSLD